MNVKGVRCCFTLSECNNNLITVVDRKVRNTWGERKILQLIFEAFSSVVKMSRADLDAIQAKLKAAIQSHQVSTEKVYRFPHYTHYRSLVHYQLLDAEVNEVYLSANWQRRRTVTVVRKYPCICNCRALSLETCDQCRRFFSVFTYLLCDRSTKGVSS